MANLLLCIVKATLLKLTRTWTEKIKPMTLATKLNRANALLHKIRNYASFNTLKAIYFAILDSHINYANLIWWQKSLILS